MYNQYNKQLKFKCFCENVDFHKAKTFTMEDLKIDPNNIPIFNLALPYMQMHDANQNEIYAGDVLCLKITEELMDIRKNTFTKSNLGKYILEHPEVTEVYLVIGRVTEVNFGTFYYECYMARNHKIDRLDLPHSSHNKEIEPNCWGEDTWFPQYTVNKGAVIVANLFVNPDFLEKCRK